ncbi:hypothetical protein [Novosphingobium cyanobacteriorum]|uniref:DUF1570 domain-containing protein n=1 Tax=Novosphingobium cyanobacteriorum TaxID=3024215 RepID=A0ABT6CJ55_9SPHN|nr:hypothetical protein [Novosphingobium cyanobacteriorum]MDF8333852.1 hypothetical protein [Novosphingobium cyanobacteriorum]
MVYTNDNEKNVRAFSEQLERYHTAIALLTSSETNVPSPSNRLTVYVVRNENEVRKLYGEDNPFLGGFYLPRAGGSIAIVSRVKAAGRDLDWSMIALLHEYAHHFIISSSAYGMPRWYSEGGAEFFASSRFNADGSVELGRPAAHRGNELFLARDVTAEELLDPAAYEKRRTRGYDAFYGKSWLLFHYLTFSKPRAGQLTNYLHLIAKGKSQREAALEAFGDFKILDRELDTYLLKNRWNFLTLAGSAIRIGAIDIRAVSAGQAEMMPVQIRSRRGVTTEQARKLLVDAREIAARFPRDPAALTALAEAEHDAGNDKEAVAAADAAIALDPMQANAYVQKGLSLFRLAEDAPDRDSAFNNAVKPFVALNRIENDHPLPLFYFYQSFSKRGRTPTDLAYQGLVRALELAPFDTSLRMTLAMEQMRRHLMPQARETLLPVAFYPHGGKLALAAQRLVAKIDASPKWDGTAAELVMSTPVGGDEGQTDAPDPAAAAGAQPGGGGGKPADSDLPAEPAQP